ncbi:prefoldin subunit 3 [Cimex lectularius]|uniref:Prefoldin subunit 3 n=1 Tax=Cimex lectularius TaxID=79782 RepID=A0A8I6TI38_CIMLE|nr:prefoldin subunit 3 [Cimex lectularius]
MEGDSTKDKEVGKEPKEKDASKKDETKVDEDTSKPFSGIPEMEFLDDVESYMESSGINGNVELVLKKLEEQHSKYKFMEFNLTSKKNRLKVQIPDLERSIDMIRMLMNKKGETEDFELSFLLAEQCYLKASIPPTDKVCLWLGANVMLEYPLDEAIELLEKNISNAKKNLERVENDLDFLRDQFTTTEVNMARVYNWNVKRQAGVKAAS